MGLPNAGKSTLIRALSGARPKVADYPFTTLYPNLGVVGLESDRSFVMADVPGLIEGAAEGAGLGIQCLRHLARTRLLLHPVDPTPQAPHANPVQQVQIIANELEKFSPELAARERWLVVNKLDLLPAAARASAVEQTTGQLGWRGPAFGISAISGAGCHELAGAVMAYLEGANNE